MLPNTQGIGLGSGASNFYVQAMKRLLMALEGIIIAASCPFIPKLAFQEAQDQLLNL